MLMCPLRRWLLTLPMLMIFVMVALAPFDWQAHDTQFVVAHLHYVLVGGFIFPMLAAAYYWLPHVTDTIMDCPC